MTTHRGSETRSIQDFLKAVFLLDGLQQPVATGSLATALSISAPSVTVMAERLKDRGLLHYRKYYGMRLTQAGARIAQNVVRRHELIERYLISTFGYSQEQAHQEADRMEHAVSDHFVDALEKKLFRSWKVVHRIEIAVTFITIIKPTISLQSVNPW